MRINGVQQVSISKHVTPNFKRNWSEHASWGAKYIKEKQKANFKLFTFPEAKRVFVEIGQKADKTFGSIKERIAQIVAAQTAALTLREFFPIDEETKIYPMENKGDGVWEAQNIDAKENASYRYIIMKGPLDIKIVKDPYAKKQADINGWSQIYNQDGYKWKATDWLEGKDFRRIVRKPNEHLRGLENLYIEEINIPTLSKEGTFEKAKSYIDKIVEKGNATAIEIMPVENTYSLQWGYDGVDKFATNTKMGGPDKLKELVDYAHSKGLNVIMDMVPNHIGPDGNYLWETGPYISNIKGDWGDLFNYEGENNKYVRDYMVNAALWWAKEFNVDGLRLDMTYRSKSDWLLKQITKEVNEHSPNTFIIAEDGREAKDGAHKVTKLENSYLTHDQELKRIDNNVDAISHGQSCEELHSIGFDSEWDFDFMHSIFNGFIKEEPINLDAIDYHIRESNHKMKLAMTHDEIGNHEGTRFIPKVIQRALNLPHRVKVNSESFRYYTAARLSQLLAGLAATEQLSQLSKSELSQIIKDSGIEVDEIEPKDVLRAFNIAKARHKLTLGTVFSIPGPKMFFQGDDEMNLSQFRFFRELSNDKQDYANDQYKLVKQIMEKGYDQREEIGRPECLINVNSAENTKHSKEVSDFVKDVVNLSKTNSALNKGRVINSYKDYLPKVHIHHLKHGDEEVLVVKNFGDHFHTAAYQYPCFPAGNWTEILNSDDAKYGGLDYVNKNRGNNINSANQNLNLAPNSIVILKKV